MTVYCWLTSLILRYVAVPLRLPLPLPCRFSKVAVVQRHSTGFWCLALRVANLRKHQILRPTVRAILTAKDSTCPQNYMLEHLTVEHIHSQVRAAAAEAVALWCRQQQQTFTVTLWL